MSRLPSCQCCQMLGREAKANLLRDGCAQLALELEYAARFAVVGRRPNLDLVARANQLGHDAQPLALGANGTLDEVRRVQLAADVGEGFGCALVSQHRGASDHTQAVGIDLSERSDRLLGETVGKVLAF